MFRKKEKGLDTTLSRGDLLDIKNVRPEELLHFQFL